MKSTETITTFLEENENYKKVEYSKLDTFISKDEEIWLFQCPKKFDISAIEGCKLKLPGKTNIQNLLELTVEESSTPTSLSFAVLLDSEKINIKSMKINGGMILRKRIEIENRRNDIGVYMSTFKVQFPADVKERHPLHGISYEKKIKKSIKDRLRKVDKIPNRIKVRTENQKEERSTIYDEQSNKRCQYSESAMDISESVENMRKRNKVEYDENDISLNWLKNI